MNSIECPVRTFSKIMPHQTALISEKLKLSYLELDEKIESIAETLLDTGVGKGTRVVLVSENSIELIAALFALLRIRAVAVPLNFRFPPLEIKRIFNDIAAERMIYSAGYQGSDIIPPDQILEKLFNSENKGEKIPDPVLNFEDNATIILSSGSAGRNRAILHSVGNHFYSALGANENISIEPEDRWLLSLPLFHVGGFAILFRVFLAGGCAAVPSSGQNIYIAARQFEVTHISMVSAQLRDFLRMAAEDPCFDKERLKALLCGGGPFSDKIILDAVKAGFPVFKTYGMTEMSSQVTTSTHPVTEKSVSGAGKLLKYRKIKVENGRIYVKGKTKFRGYITDGILKRIPKEEWFDTKDSGYFIKDELIVTGRADNMFISGGENIYPEEIESILKGNNKIDNAIIIPVDDEKFGSRPVALVEFNKYKNLTKNELKKYLSGFLPGFKIPDKFFRFKFSDQNSLKLQRNKIKKMFEQEDDIEEIL